MDSLRGFFSQPRMVRLQVLLWLFGASILVPFTRSYKKMCRQQSRTEDLTHSQSTPIISSADLPFSSRETSHSEWSIREEAPRYSRQPWHQKEVVATYARSNSCTNRTFDSPLSRSEERLKTLKSDEFSHWHDCDWEGVPKIHPFMKWYGAVSSTYFAYVATRNILPLEMIVEYIFEPSLPARCYLLGRIAPRLAISGHASMIGACAHIIWRLCHYLTKYHNLPVCMFLLQSDRDHASYSSYLNLKIPKVKEDARATDKFERPIERVFRTVNAFPICHGLHTVYRLRRNRTPEARNKLRRHMTNISVFCLILVGVGFVVALPAIILDLFLDIAYVRVYPKCSPEIDALVNSGEISIFSISMTRHKLVSLIWDLIESWFLIIDTAIAVLFAVPLVYLEDLDLRMLWAGLEKNLKNLFRQMQLRNYVSVAHIELENAPIDPKGRVKLAQLILDNRPEFCLTAHAKCQDHVTQVHELQAELGDFFQQLRLVNHFMSDSITMAMVLWPLGFCLYSFISFTEISIANIFTRLVLGSALAAIVIYCIRFCALGRRVTRSYTMLCSVVAHDNSKYKLKFLPVLDYYTMKKNMYTVLRERPYTLLTFTTVMGWTISFIIIITNLASQMNRHGTLISYLDGLY